MIAEGENIPVAVLGASGYTGQELLRLLLMHPRVNLVAVTSREHAGKNLSEVFPRYAHAPSAEGLCFTEPHIDGIIKSGAACVFLALPHGVAHHYAGHLLDAGLRVIDLSADFRLRDANIYKEYYEETHPLPELLSDAVYGLPEIHRDKIRHANLIASPGCYPTSVLLPTIPLIRENVIVPNSIVVSSVSGASGAGKKADTSLLFTEVNESVRSYSIPKHRHLSEIEQELSAAATEAVTISFIPHLMPVTCGIHSTIICKLTCPAEEASSKVEKALEDAYLGSRFVRILGNKSLADTKHVTRTNFVDIGWVIDPRTNRLIITSAEDNLGKGAGGQAIQSFNIMNALPEDMGLLNF